MSVTVASRPRAAGLGRIAPVVKLLESCNLACSYCYQADLLAPRQVMARDTLDRVLAELARVTEGPLQILWFGGEPTQVGLKYFREAVEAARAIFGPRLRHAIQTNATLVDDEWAALFAEHRFTVTVSLDGPADLHDACRVHHGGQGSHASVVRAVEIMQRRGVEPRASCVVAAHTLPHAERLVDYFAELGLHEIDFPPGMRFVGGDFEALVGAEAYGHFMVRVMERWLAHGRTGYRVRSLAGLARAMAGKAPNFCKLEGSCARYVTFAHNGDIYPCDEFTGQDGHRLGNVLSDALDDILRSERAQAIHETWTALPRACEPCEWRDVCRGGCPFERRVGGGVDHRSVVCEGLKILYARMRREIPLQA